MSATSNVFAIEKFIGQENYSEWKFSMEAFLKLDDLWEAIDENTKVVDPKKDQKALSKIILAVEKVNYSHIKNSKTAREAWCAIQSAFEDSGLTRKVGLLRKLVTTKLDNCKTVEVYCDTIISTAYKLNDMGFVVNDEWVGTLLLAGLPEEYKPMIMGIESSGLRITGVSINVKLLQDVKGEEPQKQNKQEKSTFYSNPKKTQTANSVKCYNCNKYGHIAKYCRENRDERENRNQREKQNKFKKKPTTKTENKSFFGCVNSTSSINNEE